MEEEEEGEEEGSEGAGIREEGRRRRVGEERKE